MISSSKKSFKRIWSGIIIFILSSLVVMSILTKVIYDASFSRYEARASIPAWCEEITQTRREISFKSGENDLCGYLYDSHGKGLILFIPGFNAETDEYLAQIKSLNDRGWAVFSFDTTGSGKSGGDSAIGFSQVTEDLRAAMNTLKQNQNFGYEDIYLVGHSRGAYAAGSVLDEDYNIKAVALISGVDSAMDAIMQPVADRIGFLAYTNYPLLWLYQVMLFGTEDVNTSVSREIVESDTPALIVQGTEDDFYREDKYSVYSECKELGAKNVEYYLSKAHGSNGHTSLLFGDGGFANEELMDKIDSFFKANS